MSLLAMPGIAASGIPSIQLPFACFFVERQALNNVNRLSTISNEGNEISSTTLGNNIDALFEPGTTGIPQSPIPKVGLGETPYMYFYRAGEDRFVKMKYPDTSYTVTAVNDTFNKNGVHLAAVGPLADKLICPISKTDANMRAYNLTLGTYQRQEATGPFHAVDGNCDRYPYVIQTVTGANFKTWRRNWDCNSGTTPTYENSVVLESIGCVGDDIFQFGSYYLYKNGVSFYTSSMTAIGACTFVRNGKTYVASLWYNSDNTVYLRINNITDGNVVLSNQALVSYPGAVPNTVLEQKLNRMAFDGKFLYAGINWKVTADNKYKMMFVKVDPFDSSSYNNPKTVFLNGGGDTAGGINRLIFMNTLA